MFVAIEERVGAMPQVRLINTKTGEYATILPTFGGNVNNLMLRDNRCGLISVIDGYVTEADAAENSGYKSAKLTPFPNRLDGGSYVHNRHRYKLAISRPQEGHAIHGLWHSAKYEVENLKSSSDKASVNLVFVYDGKTKGYPFACTVQLKYRLSNKGLRCTTTVSNDGEKPMPFGDGWHPYFKLNTASIDDLALMLPPVRYMQTNEKNIPTGETVNFLEYLNGASLRDNKLDHGFELINHGKKIQTVISDPQTGVQLAVWQNATDNQYRYLQIYTPADRKTIAIEPMSCAANAFNNKMGLVVLEPKMIFKAKYGVCLL